MKNTLSIFAVLVFFAASSLFSQPDPQRMMLKKLNLTDTQQEQFEKSTFDMKKKQIELGAKLATLKLEMHRLMTAETLDKAAIENKMKEIATQQIALRMNHLNAWSEKNKVLNADQQKIWKGMMLRHMQNSKGDMPGCMPEPKRGRMQRPMMHGLQGDDDMPQQMEIKIEKKINKE
ncbi:MAG: periplasmic heavy metal sensor [Bacteroidota bacterium]